MNKFLRVLGLGLMIATFAFAALAQTEKEKVYNTYMENYQGPEIAKLQIALDAAKEYVAKFPEDTDQVNYFKEAIPTLEASIGKGKTAAEAKKESDAWYALLGNLQKANKEKNWAQVMSLGKQALDTQFKYLDQGFLETAKVKEQKLDVNIVLGVMGYDRAAEKNDTFNNDALNYLRQSIQLIESGQTSKNYGAIGYELKNKDNALGFLNYYMGYIMYYRQKKEDDNSLGYFYKATQVNSESKNISAIYNLIGLKFYNQLADLDKQRLAKIEAYKTEQTEEGKAKLETEIKDIIAQEKGVAERGMEAFARAYNLATQEGQYKAGVLQNFEDLYKFRYPKKPEGVKSYITTAAAKPLTNPATPVQPIVEEDPVDKAATSTTPSTKPATTPATKPAVTTTAKPAATNSTAKTVKPATTNAKTVPAKKPRKK